MMCCIPHNKREDFRAFLMPLNKATGVILLKILQGNLLSWFTIHFKRFMRHDPVSKETHSKTSPSIITTLVWNNRLVTVENITTTIVEVIFNQRQLYTSHLTDTYLSMASTEIVNICRISSRWCGVVIYRRPRSREQLPQYIITYELNIKPTVNRLTSNYNAHNRHWKGL